MNGEDMYIEYNENNRWILAGYYANEKLYIIDKHIVTFSQVFLQNIKT